MIGDLEVMCITFDLFLQVRPLWVGLCCEAWAFRGESSGRTTEHPGPLLRALRTSGGAVDHHPQLTVLIVDRLHRFVHDEHPGGALCQRRFPVTREGRPENTCAGGRARMATVVVQVRQVSRSGSGRVPETLATFASGPLAKVSGGGAWWADRKSVV